MHIGMAKSIVYTHNCCNPLLSRCNIFLITVKLQTKGILFLANVTFLAKVTNFINLVKSIIILRIVPN